MTEWTLSEQIDLLRDGSVYPHATDSEIRITETHISYVVLTGEYAYKLKKAVDLGFLDFSTLEKRRHYCHEELRLNRAFAPDLYLDVMEVHWDGQAVSFEPMDGSAVVDYAVRMRQFDEADLLIRMFDEGRLDLEFAARLGATVAQIHGTTPPIHDDRFGTYQAVADSVRVIVDTVHPFVGDAVDPALWESLTGYLEDFLAHHAWLFDIRVKEGRIRECHGDLHMGNICVFENRIELFDRIEFNEDFKNIDVMYDLAFLTMDFCFRGRPDLANRAMNTYVEATGDYSGVILLPFYESVRALIRSEVALLLTADESADESVRRTAGENAAAYLKHAAGCAKPSQGEVIVVCGVSGTGKSTFSHALVERGTFVHVRSDAIRKHLGGVALSATDESLYDAAHTAKTYAHLIELGVLLSERGNRVILDAQFPCNADRLKLVEKLAGFDVPVHFIVCEAPEAVIHERLNERENDVSDATAELIPQQREAFEAFDGIEDIGLDTTDEQAVENLLQKLSIET